jgi:glycosyltransferase involved in cell wall biosynthesis
MQRILFISHEATRTGAPLVLLNILQNIKKMNVLFDILLINGGDLQNDFIKLSDKVFFFKNKGITLLFIRLLTHISVSTDHIFLAKSVKRILNFFQDFQYFAISKKLIKRKYSLIYSNTVCSLELTSKLKIYLPVPAILHIHELGYSIDSLIGHDYFLNHITIFDHFIAVSDSVKENLIHNYKIDESRISIAYPFSHNIMLPDKREEDIREELNINKKAFVVGASGTGTWVKGCDIFINMAYLFFKKYPDSICVFVWVGKIIDSDYKKIKYDLDKSELIEKVKFIGEKINPINYYNMFDVFTLVSRVDSCPLVCLENAFLSKPLICFDNTGYMPQFIENDAGFVIPYMDIEDMACKIYLLYKDKDLREKLGIAARDKYSKKFNIESSLKPIINCINRFIRL